MEYTPLNYCGGKVGYYGESSSNQGHWPCPIEQAAQVGGLILSQDYTWVCTRYGKMDSNRTYRICLCQASWHRDSCSGGSTLKEPTGLACDAHGMKSRAVYKRVSEERVSLADTTCLSNQPETLYYFVLLLFGTSCFACSQQLAILTLACSHHCLNYLCKEFCLSQLYNHGIVLSTHSRPESWFGKST